MRSVRMGIPIMTLMRPFSHSSLGGAPCSTDPRGSGSGWEPPSAGAGLADGAVTKAHPTALRPVPRRWRRCVREAGRCAAPPGVVGLAWGKIRGRDPCNRSAAG